MIKSASRTLVRQSLPTFRAARTRRFLSTAPPAQKSRSWKNGAVRWGIAIGGLYYHNTSNVFADEPAYSMSPSSPQTDDSSLPTLESISASRQPKLARATSTPPRLNPPTSAQTTTAAVDPGSLDETEEEASQEGAFNEETGEINWDCPCLGGMAHGPCGEHFRAAFSCFVFSKDEPKGMDCIEHFKTMQGCFREHPDVYGDEMAGDEEEGETGEMGQENEGAFAEGEVGPDTAATSALEPTKPSSRASKVEAENPHDATGSTERAKAATEQVSRDHGEQSESDVMVPKAAHDATKPKTEK